MDVIISLLVIPMTNPIETPIAAPNPAPPTYAKIAIIVRANILLK